MDTNPSEKSREIHRILIKISQYIGVHMPDKSKMNARLMFAIFTFVLWIVTVTNGIILSWGDPVKMCHAILPIAFLFTYLGRSYNKFYLDCESQNRNLQSKTENFYEKWEVYEKYRKLLLQRVDESAFYMKILVVSTFIFYHMPVLSVDYDNITTGSRLLNMYAPLPFIDPDSDLGFILNTIILHSSAPIGFFGIIILDCTLVFYGYQLVPMCDMICAQLEEFGDDLRVMNEYRNLKNTVSAKVNHPNKHPALENEKVKRNPKSAKLEKRFETDRMKLKAIIIEHQKYNSFIKDIIDLMFVPCFISVVCNSLSIALSILITFNVALKLGIACGLLYFSQVLSPCLMGLLIQNQNDRLFRNCCAFPWYYLDKTDKKLFLKFIQVIQNTKVFRLPIVGTLNMEVFANVMNASYTYFNYFLNFVSK